MLVALLVVALVLLTGVSVREPPEAHGRRPMGGGHRPRGGPAVEGEEVAEDDHPTDPFGRTVVADDQADGDPSDQDEDASPDLEVAELDPPTVALPNAATGRGRGSQLEMKLGPTVGK